MTDDTVRQDPNLRNPIHLLAFGLGSGVSPFAPGTMGTLVAVPIYLMIDPLPLFSYFVTVAVAFVAGVWLCDQTSRDLGVHDHSGIVWDEIVGYLVTMSLAPEGWQWILVGFVLFRIFDIFKPWPIRSLDERVGGGFGIMVDDLLAGVYALVVMLMLQWMGAF